MAEATKKVAKSSAKPYVTMSEKDAARKSREKRQARKHHPALDVDREGRALVKLTEVPKDFDPKVHKPLRKQDFEKESTFVRYLAGRHRAVADKMDAAADRLDRYGTKKAQQLAARLDKLADLRKTLEAALQAEGASREGAQ
jgi:hypothetical protein